MLRKLRNFFKTMKFRTIISAVSPAGLLASPFLKLKNMMKGKK